MENIGGIFVVLICGLIVAIFMAMLEFLWTLRHSEASEVSFQWLPKTYHQQQCETHWLLHALQTEPAAYTQKAHRPGQWVKF